MATLDLPKYLDIDSTYRNRNDYPNPNNFVISQSYSGKDSSSATAADPVINAVPYTGSTDPPGVNTTGVSASTSSITLDPQEPSIDNFYINSILEIAGEFRIITAYVGATKVATVSPAFTLLPAPGTIYFTRLESPIFVGTVAAAPVPTNNTFSLNAAASNTDEAYTNNYIRFTSGPNNGLIFRITNYVGSTRTITTARNMPNIPVAGNTLEIDSFSRDNAKSLLHSSYNTVPNLTYEIELLWLSVPNQTLGVGYGGTLDRYPYIYVALYNEGKRLANQVLISDNPNSPLVLFKVPVDQYFGNTSFITLTNARTKQYVKFDITQDIRFAITLPDGTVCKFFNDDNLSPNFPDPFLQVNALFSIRSVGKQTLVI